MVGRKADTVVQEEEDIWRGRIKKGKTASCPPGVPRRALEEERWFNRGGEGLNGSAPDCKSVVLGSNPAPPQHTANSVSPEVDSNLE